MPIFGSSIITNLGSGFSVKGATGPTGPTGFTGPMGPGLTGNTGPDVVGITLIDRYFVTTFSNGATVSSVNQIYGQTGNAVYSVAASNIGSGVSLAYGLTGNTVLLRPIKWSVDDYTYLTITNYPTYIQLDLQAYPAGLTAVTSVSTDRNLLKFNSTGKLERVSNTFGVTYDNTIRKSITGMRFINANVFEHVRGIGWTGSTGAIQFTSSPTGVTCTFNPFVKEYDAVMFGSKSNVYIADFCGNTASIVVSDYTETTKTVYSFDIIITGAKNPSDLTKRFSSNILWPNNTLPCFSVAGVTCDFKVTLFGLQGKWYATAVPTSSKCMSTLFQAGC